LEAKLEGEALTELEGLRDALEKFSQLIDRLIL